MYTVIAETESYSLRTCQATNHSLLLRKKDNNYCYIDDLDSNILSEVIDYADAFDKISSNYVFINPLTEKQNV